MTADAASPRHNPGFLDTFTWDEATAVRLALSATRDGRFSDLARTVVDESYGEGRALDRTILAASRPPLGLVPASACASGTLGLWLIGVLENGQRVLVNLRRGRARLPRSFGRPLAVGDAGDGRQATVELYALDLPRLRAFLAEMAPAYQPAVPDRPGLGIGGRMGVLDLPVAVQTVKKHGLCASVIQTSVYREVAPLADLSRMPLPQIDLPGVGRVPLGHTGMSITGHYLAMMVERIMAGDPTPIVADADHLPLRGTGRIERELARRLIGEAADRSLYTLDPHFCFYGGDARLWEAATAGRFAEVEAAFRRRFPRGARNDLVGRYVRKKFRVPDLAGGAGHVITMTNAELMDCALRFQEPLLAIEDAVANIRRVKGRTRFAIEVSVDEAPGMSEPHHFYYLCAELERRGIPSFSLAPGLGFTKLDVDVQDPEGPFATRVRILAGISKHFGAVMGIHSGDGKSVITRRILAKTTGGNFWYKVSPDRQRSLFAALAMSPKGSVGRLLFQEVYRTALSRVAMLTAGGSDETARVARETLAITAKHQGLAGTLKAELKTLLIGRAPRASAWRAFGKKVALAPAKLAPGDLADTIAHDYAFATVGARDSKGRFQFRGRFFTLPEETLEIYHKLDRSYLADLVRSLRLDR